MTIQFKPAVRTRVFLKILIKGPTNGGKTFGALHIAYGLAPGKIALADSEHDRSLFYSDVIPFQHAQIDSFHPKAYIAVINAAVEAGFEVLILDSLSHCWLDVLARKDAYDKANPRSNQWTNWALFGEEWDDLLRTILEAPIHIICTARAKMAHEQVEQNGKKSVVKLGLAPQLRENTEYEFALCFDVETTTDNRHPAQVSKDNTGVFSEPGKVWDLADGTVPALLRQWMTTARDIERPTPETQKAIDDALLALPEAIQGKARRRVSERKQRGLPEHEAQELLAQIRGMGTPKSAAPAAPSTPTAPTTAEAPVPAAPMTSTPTPAAETASTPAGPTLSDAAAHVITIGGKPMPLGELSPTVLRKLHPMAFERGDTKLMQYIDIVLADHDARAAEAQAAAKRESAERQATAEAMI